MEPSFPFISLFPIESYDSPKVYKSSDFRPYGLFSFPSFDRSKCPTKGRFVQSVIDHPNLYHADFYDFLMDGEMWCYTEGQSERTVYKPSDAAHLGKGAAKGYCVKDHAWMLEDGFH